MQPILKYFPRMPTTDKVEDTCMFARGCHNAYPLLEYSRHKDTAFCRMYRLFREECHASIVARSITRRFSMNYRFTGMMWVSTEPCR